MIKTQIHRCLKSDYIFEDHEEEKNNPPHCPVCGGATKPLTDSFSELKRNKDIEQERENMDLS